MLKIIICNLFIFFSINLFSEIAVLPYVINNPSSSFSAKDGIQYSKLLSVGSIYKKNLKILSPRDVILDLKRIGVDYNKKITLADLKLFGKIHYLDYILVGRLSKVHGKYISKSILYSVRDGKSINHIRVFSNSLAGLAEKEINEVFANFPDKKISKIKSADIVFLLDMSYNINKDWREIKKGIILLSKSLIDEQRIDTRIKIVPYSSKSIYRKSFISDNSVKKIISQLERLKPTGRTNGEIFSKALKYSVKYIKWRKNADKNIFILSNSNFKNAEFVDTYGLIAGRKKIKINAVLFGNINSNNQTLFSKLTEMTSGVNKNITYFQDLYDLKGKRIILYYENDRLFKSSVKKNSWREGLLKRSGILSAYYTPVKDLDELKISKNITPYNMADKFATYTATRIISKKKLVSNFSSVMKTFFTKGEINNKESIKGKVLVSDGELSLWLYIKNFKTLNLFKKKKNTRTYFPLGLNVVIAKGETYGISFNIKILDIESVYIPESIYTNFSKIIKNRNYYIKSGFYSPPLWFVKVKVEKIVFLNDSKDIRDW
jgi:von Willebrand factor type A domain-containing protein